MKVLTFLALAAIALLAQAVFNDQTLIPCLIAGVAGAGAGIVFAPPPAHDASRKAGPVRPIFAACVGLFVGYAAGTSVGDQPNLLSVVPPSSWAYVYVLCSAYLPAFTLAQAIQDGRFENLYHDEFRICIRWFLLLGIALLLSGRAQLIGRPAIDCFAAGLFGTLVAQAFHFLPIRRWRNARTSGAFAISAVLSFGVLSIPFAPPLPAPILCIACAFVSFGVLAKLIDFVNDRITPSGPDGIRCLN